MTAGMQDALYKAIREVLEQFAFMFAETEAGSCDLNANHEYSHVTMTYTGPAEGVISLTAPRILCEAIAANVLGIDQTLVTHETADDALKELLNISCGLLTFELYGSQVALDLTVPLVFHIAQGKWRELWADPESIHFVVEGHPLLAALTSPYEEASASGQ